MPRTQKRIKTETSPSSYYQFPYVRFHGQSYPLIPISLRYKNKGVNTFALLDSGASMSVFRPEIAKALRLPKRAAGEARLATGTGGVDIGYTKLEVKVGKTKFMAKIGFSKNYVASFNILGREGFFHRFSICFNELMRTVVMVPLRGNK